MVVLDEMPCLVREDPSFEGTLQKVFDRTLSKLPVLLILIGSDIAMMEQLNTYGRPFYQRGTEMVVPPLNPAEVAAMLDLPPADAFDAYLISGGLQLILEEWPQGAPGCGTTSNWPCAGRPLPSWSAASGPWLPSFPPRRRLAPSWAPSVTANAPSP